MWSSTVGLINGKKRYLTAETFGFKVNSNGQALKKRQQWTIEPFLDNSNADITASITSQSQPVHYIQTSSSNKSSTDSGPNQVNSSPANFSSLSSVRSSSNGSAASESDVCNEDHENVAIKSHLNKYLAVDSFGNVTCDLDEKNESTRFTITICSMSQGTNKDEQIFWALRNVERGYYLGTTDDGMICCNAKMPKSAAELWLLHLIPARGASFFSLKSMGRKRFARVVEVDQQSGTIRTANAQLGQVQLDATTSWGPETLFQLRYFEGGRYSIVTSDYRYLTNEGTCVKLGTKDEHDQSTLPPIECLFTLEYHGCFLAFRDSFSHYLAAAGRSSVLKSRSIGVSKDELFTFEPAPVQISMKATFNNRWVSIKQGVDVSANQIDRGNKFETFQMTYHMQTDLWSIMTHDCNFWNVSQYTSTICVCRPEHYEGLNKGIFRLIWSENDATFSLRYVDRSAGQDRLILARKSGQLYLGSGQSQEAVSFVMRLQNRKLLNLRPVEGSGFVGLKSCPNVGGLLLEANKTRPDSFLIEYSENQCLQSNEGDARVDQMSKRNIKIRPEIARKVDNHNHGLFNVKLASNISDSVHHDNTNRYISSKDQSNHEAYNGRFLPKQIDDDDETIIDDNNNNCPYVSSDDQLLNGNVESSPIPSVASIINTFTSMRLDQENAKRHTCNPTKIQTSTRVSQLASSFASDPQTDSVGFETSKAITSCQDNNNNNHISNKEKSNTESSALHECCYLKNISNNRYLAASESNKSVTCDATNMASAKPWILELRSHNAVAIRGSDDQTYLQLGTNGLITLSKCEPSEASLWEF